MSLLYYFSSDAAFVSSESDVASVVALASVVLLSATDASVAAVFTAGVSDVAVSSVAVVFTAGASAVLSVVVVSAALSVAVVFAGVLLSSLPHGRGLSSFPVCAGGASGVMGGIGVGALWEGGLTSFGCWGRVSPLALVWYIAVVVSLVGMLSVVAGVAAYALPKLPSTMENTNALFVNDVENFIQTSVILS